MPPENPYRDAIAVANDPDEEIARSHFLGDLDRDERILWAGRPRQGIYLTASDLILVPFSLLWGGFAFFWEWSVLNGKNAPFFFLLFGGGFCAVGLYVIIGRFFFDAFMRSRTFYAVTDRRVLIVSRLQNRQLVSVDLENLPMSLDEREDGSGTLSFGAGKLPLFADSSWPANGRQRGSVLPPMFRRIENARAVLARIREAKETLRLPQKTSDKDK